MDVTVANAQVGPVQNKHGDSWLESRHFLGGDTL